MKVYTVAHAFQMVALQIYIYNLCMTFYCMSVSIERHEDEILFSNSHIHDIS